MRFIAGLNTPIPKELEASMEYAINSLLRRALGDPVLDALRIGMLLEEASENQVTLDSTTLEYTIRRNLERMSETFLESSGDLKALETLRDGLKVARSLPFPVILWSVQNKIYEMYQRSYKRIAGRAARQDVAATAWTAAFRSLAELADVKVE
jgi:hypothetical protein